MAGMNSILLKNGLVLTTDVMAGASNSRYFDYQTKTFYIAYPNPFPPYPLPPSCNVTSLLPGYPTCPGQVNLADGTSFFFGDPGAHDPTFMRFIKDCEALAPPYPGDYTRHRYYPTLTVLHDGSVLVTAGYTGTQGPALDVPDRYFPDPEYSNQGYFRPQAYPQTDFLLPTYPLMALLSNGRVLFAGGSEHGATSYDGYSRVFDPVAGSWAKVNDNVADTTTGESFAIWGKDVIYKWGGYLAVNGAETPSSAICRLNLTNPQATHKWEVVKSTSGHCVEFHTTALPDGRLLASGGTHIPELFNPADSSLVNMDPMPPLPDGFPRGHHGTALLLPDARVLFTSGQNNTCFESCGKGCGTLSVTALLFSPPYLFKPGGADGDTITPAERPSFSQSQLPNEIGTGSVLALSSLQAGTGATSVTKASFMRLGSSTHEVDMEQRYVPVPFTWSTKKVTAPASAEQAPPGHYMVFFMNNLGRPSVSKIVRLWGIMASTLTYNVQTAQTSFQVSGSWKTNKSATLGDQVVFTRPDGTTLTVDCAGQTCSNDGYQHNVNVQVGECVNGDWYFQFKSRISSVNYSLSEKIKYTIGTCSGGGGGGFANKRADVQFLTATPAPDGDRVAIEFGIKADGHATIAVYDVAGRKLATVVDEDLEQGSYSREWSGRKEDGSRLGPGVYFVQLRSHGETLKQKVALNR